MLLCPRPCQTWHQSREIYLEHKLSHQTQDRPTEVHCRCRQFAQSTRSVSPHLQERQVSEYVAHERLLEARRLSALPWMYYVPDKYGALNETEREKKCARIDSNIIIQANHRVRIICSIQNVPSRRSYSNESYAH